MATVKTRFAPSPTGYLHVGNIRTALVNWLFTRKSGGQFVLRIDDTDKERSKEEFTRAIKEDLQWLGLQWDETAHQSARFERYHAAIEQLKAAGRLYAAYETPEELEMQRKMLSGRGLPPVYKRATGEQQKKYEAEGRKAHWRFLLNDEAVEWDDLIRGKTHFKATHMSDPVLIREDGVPVYTLASVTDDHDLGITHVIRGEDHVSNTAVQVQLAKALGYASPQFAHLALLKTKEGGLSKREGGGDVRSLREAGVLPMAINSYLGRIGTSDPIEPMADIQPLVESFDFSKFGRAPAHYDEQELERLNEKLLHQLPFAAVKGQMPFADEAFWLVVRANAKNLAEAHQWFAILHEQVRAELNHDERTFVRSTIDKLPPAPWDEHTWDSWLAAVKPGTERKGKDLFMPLRIALTGREHGPELKKLLPLLGRDKVLQRLSQEK